MKKLKQIGLAVTLVCGMIAPAQVYAKVPGVPVDQAGATQGIVAVSHPAAAEVGKAILAKGGNAVDAAAGIQLALNVVEPMMSGIGGGGFMMLYQKEQNKITVLDSREMAPKGVDGKMFLDKDGKPIPFYDRHTHGNAVGVPGTLLGVETALNKYGTKKLAEVIDPAIELAEKGVPVNWITAQYIEGNTDKLKKHGTAATVFLPRGEPLKEGELLVQPDLAKTLKLIKKEGSKVFYEGEIAKAIAAEVQRTGGSMTTDDLKNYVVKEREPVRGTFRGYEVVSMPPPSSGGLTLIQILKLMEGFDNSKAGPQSVEYLHRLIEANHLAYADRAAYMADEDFYPVPKKGLIDEKYIEERRKLIKPDRANDKVEKGDPWKAEGKTAPAPIKRSAPSVSNYTTHFSVMDKWGNLVSYTTTIEDLFGSGIMVPGYGFMLNNELTDFDATPGGVNEVEAGKRPRSSMTPTIVLKDGKPFMAVGSPGGSTIIASVSQTILNVIEHNMPIQEAILAPRIFSSSYPAVTWEAGIEQDVVLKLMSMGHVFAEKPGTIGNVQAVIYDLETGKMYGGADNTREGTVLGVDQVTYKTAKPEKASQPAQAPFTLKVNGNAYAFTPEQLALMEGKAFVQADKLLLGLTGKRGAYKQDEVNIQGKAFLPVSKVAKALGFTTMWDEKEKVVSLEKK